MKHVNAAHEMDMSERACKALGSTGCQPVLFGSLPKSSSNVRCAEFLRRVGRRRQAADDNRLAACAPQTIGDRHSL